MFLFILEFDYGPLPPDIYICLTNGRVAELDRLLEWTTIITQIGGYLQIHRMAIHAL